MKIFKSFMITLAAVLAVGVLFLVGRGMLKADTADSKDAETIKIEDAGSGQSDGNTVSGSSGGFGGTGSKVGSQFVDDSGSKASSSEKKKSNANPIVKAVVSEAIDVYVDNADGEIKDVAESMTKEDRETVTEIIADNVSLDAIPQIKSYLSSGDKDSIVKYAEENFTEEQIAQLQEIMSKYVTE